MRNTAFGLLLLVASTCPALADCKEEIMTVMDRSMLAGPYRTEASLISGERRLVVSSIVVPPADLRTKTVMDGKTREIIKIGSDVWTNEGNGWQVASAAIAARVSAMMAGMKTVAPDLVNDADCQGKKSVDGREVLAYSYKIDLPGGKGSSSNTLYADPSSRLPLRVIVDLRAGGRKSRTDMTYFFDSLSSSSGRRSSPTAALPARTPRKPSRPLRRPRRIEPPRQGPIDARSSGRPGASRLRRTSHGPALRRACRFRPRRDRQGSEDRVHRQGRLRGDDEGSRRGSFSLSWRPGRQGAAAHFLHPGAARLSRPLAGRHSAQFVAQIGLLECRHPLGHNVVDAAHDMHPGKLGFAFSGNEIVYSCSEFIALQRRPHASHEGNSRPLRDHCPVRINFELR